MTHVAPAPARHRSTRGLTMIELLVAMTLGLLMVLVAATTLVVARQGLSHVDAASQLRDNARFAQDLLQTVGVQAGFKSLAYATTASPPPTEGVEHNPPPAVFGLNNASRRANQTWDAGNTRALNSAGYGSDILVLRYQSNVDSVDAQNADQTMIDCMGVASERAPARRDDRMLSLLHVGVGPDGEPALQCSRSANNTAPYDTQPLVHGVENFQVLYGVDGVAPGNTLVPIPKSSADSVAERYLRADQLTVAGNTEASYANWRRVRSLRIGLVVRGPPGSALPGEGRKLYPLGAAFATAEDPMSEQPASSDSRLRQVVTFTVHLRNYQEDL